MSRLIDHDELYPEDDDLLWDADDPKYDKFPSALFDNSICS